VDSPPASDDEPLEDDELLEEAALADAAAEPLSSFPEEHPAHRRSTPAQLVLRRNTVIFRRVSWRIEKA
jgi:hypothetical protein